MKIDLTKLPQNENNHWLCKTRNGSDAIIYTNNGRGIYPVVGQIGEALTNWTLTGENVIGETLPADLIMPVPWTLGRTVNGHTLGEGQEWHRQDGWTGCMLPHGTRPLLAGELSDEDSDEHFNGRHGWSAAAGGCYKWANIHCRTRRPLPAVAEKWAAEKAFDPYEALKQAHAAGRVIQCQMEGVNRWQRVEHVSRINLPVGRYRVKPEPVLVPLGPEDVPPMSVLRHYSWKPFEHVNPSVFSLQVEFVVGEAIAFRTYERLQSEPWFINRLDGYGWVRCEKPADAKEAK